MTLDQFKSRKQAIQENLEWLLVQAKLEEQLGGKHFRRCVMKINEVTIEIRQKAEYVEKDIQKFITYKLAFPNALVEVHKHTERDYCYDNFVGTYYKFQHLVLVDEITEPMVQKRMRKFVARQMGVKYAHNLKCEVMQLFKEGKISWDDAKALHLEGCKI